MNPDDRLGEAGKQIGHAQDSEDADDYAEQMLDNALQLVERSQRRIKRRRVERERPQAATAEDGDDDE